MYSDECETCGRETRILSVDGICRYCILAERNGGYACPEYLEGNDRTFAKEGAKVVAAFEALLSKHAEFQARYGQ